MSFSISSNLIYQWYYCPRKVYYMELIKVKVTQPIWVAQGQQFHTIEEKLWNRRDLSRFKLSEGKKHHRVNMKSEKLNLHGIADMVIETSDRVYPVEFKLSAQNIKRGSIMQLVSYAMLAEEHFGKQCEVGFLVGKGEILHKIVIEETRKKDMLEVVDDIRKMIKQGFKPDSDAGPPQCSACEYVNFCNDR